MEYLPYHHCQHKKVSIFVLTIVHRHTTSEKMKACWMDDCAYVLQWFFYLFIGNMFVTRCLCGRTKWWYGPSSSRLRFPFYEFIFTFFGSLTLWPYTRMFPLLLSTTASTSTLTPDERIKMYSLYMCAYWLGLCNTLTKRFRVGRLLTLNKRYIQQWTTDVWLWAVAIMSVGLGLFGYQTLQHMHNNVLQIRMTGVVIVTLYYYVYARIYQSHYGIHVHHSFLFAVLSFYCAPPYDVNVNSSYLTNSLFFYCVGMMVEGISHHGIPSMLVRRY